MPISDALLRVGRTHLDRYGHDVTVRTYSLDPSGGYAADDETKVETTNSPYTTRAFVESRGTAQADRNEAGTGIDGTHVVYLADDFDSNGELAGMGDDRPPSVVEDGAARYRVLRVIGEGDGFLVLDAEVKS